MEFFKLKRFERVAYRCQCKICGTKVCVDKKDLHYAGYLEYIKGIFELYISLYDPNHKPKGRFEFYEDSA